LRLTCCPGPFWRCGGAKALLERFWEITAPSRPLSSLRRIDPRMVRGVLRALFPSR
jgi:hypothetical protein